MRKALLVQYHEGLLLVKLCETLRLINTIDLGKCKRLFLIWLRVLALFLRSLLLLLLLIYLLNGRILFLHRSRILLVIILTLFNLRRLFAFFNNLRRFALLYDLFLLLSITLVNVLGWLFPVDI